MNMKDLHSHVEIVNAITPQVATETQTATDIDLKDFMSAEIVFQVGVGGITFDGANRIVLKIEHSDDAATYAAVPAGMLLGVGLSTGGGPLPDGDLKGLVAEHAAAAAYRFGYIGGKRYLKVVAEFAGTHGTGTALSAIVIKGRPLDKPAPDQA